MANPLPVNFWFFAAIGAKNTEQNQLTCRMNGIISVWQPGDGLLRAAIEPSGQWNC